MSGGEASDHNFSASDGAISYVSSRSDRFLDQQLTPPMVQGVYVDEYIRVFHTCLPEQAIQNPALLLLVEGTQAVPHNIGSISSRSDDSDFEPTSKTHTPSHRNFLSGRSFVSKAIHPLLSSDYTVDADIACGYASISHSSSDASDSLEHEFPAASPSNRYEGSKCGLCKRPLERRSPWGSSRIVRCGDKPTASILSCFHVYHAECLERATPKAQRADPACPLCERPEERIATEQWALCRLKSGSPRLRPLGEEGQPSRVWSCGQARDCMQRALHTPKHGRAKIGMQP